MFEPESDWLRALRQVRQSCERADWPLAERQLAAMRRADARHPLTWLAQARYEQARQSPEQACSSLERALVADPQLFDAWLSLGQLRAQLRQYSAALQALQRALSLRPLQMQALELLLALLQLTGDIPAVQACLRLLLDETLERQPAFADLTPAQQQALLQRRPAWAALEIVNAFSWEPLSRRQLNLRLHNWRARFAVGLGPLSGHGHLLPDAERPLRVGYVSNEWQNPTLRHVFFGPWQHADRSRFVAYAYADDGSESLPEALQGCFAGLRPTVGLDDWGFYQRIQADAIDILVDLSGFFNARRLPALLRKPAPVQINAGFNPPFGLHLPCYDALLSDAGLLPPELIATEREPLLYLPAFFCWQPPQTSPPVPAARPGLRLGAAASANKLSDASLQLWARVLQALPEARLTLKNQVYRDAGVCQRLAARFARLGGDVSRLDFEDNRQRDDLISFFAECDLILETWPYGGALSVCDACWAGVPMPGLAGEFRLAEAVRSLLDSLDLLAADTEAYLALVVTLARDPQRRALLRRVLPQRLLASPVCDHRGQMQALEAHYRALWRSWLRG